MPPYITQTPAAHLRQLALERDAVAGHRQRAQPRQRRQARGDVHQVPAHGRLAWWGREWEAKRASSLRHAQAVAATGRQLVQAATCMRGREQVLMLPRALTSSQPDLVDAGRHKQRRLV